MSTSSRNRNIERRNRIFYRSASSSRSHFNLQQTIDVDVENASSVRTPGQEVSNSFHSLGQLILDSADLTSNPVLPRMDLNSFVVDIISSDSESNSSNFGDLGLYLSDIDSDFNQPRPVDSRRAASVRWVFSVNSTSKSYLIESLEFLKRTLQELFIPSCLI